MIKDDEKIVFWSYAEILFRNSCYRRVDISARRNVLLLERLAVYGDFVYSNVFCRNSFDVQKPRFIKETVERKRKESEQRLVIKLSGLMFAAGFVTAGLNFRFQWIVLPAWVSLAAAGVFLISYLFYAEVLRENVYLSRTV